MEKVLSLHKPRFGVRENKWNNLIILNSGVFPFLGHWASQIHSILVHPEFWRLAEYYHAIVRPLEVECLFPDDRGEWWMQPCKAPKTWSGTHKRFNFNELNLVMFSWVDCDHDNGNLIFYARKAVISLPSFDHELEQLSMNEQIERESPCRLIEGVELII